jgi:hypothetical protein
MHAVIHEIAFALVFLRIWHPYPFTMSASSSMVEDESPPPTGGVAVALVVFASEKC